MLSCIATTVMATALTTALPPIAKDLGVSMQTGQWLTSGYSLAMGACAVPLIIIPDRVPARQAGEPLNRVCARTGWLIEANATRFGVDLDNVMWQ